MAQGIVSGDRVADRPKTYFIEHSPDKQYNLASAAHGLQFPA